MPRPTEQRPEFAILLAGDAGTQLFTIRAETRHLAVRAAEASVDGMRAVEVVATFSVAGRCGRCGAILFTDDEPLPWGDGIRCRDC